ncbi:hypothetical protein QBC43DRAFT_355255 [Cladorrhinum sp. PSN259]|nr:hypothetical protein QBC43DRAFT_355255 [Cladorrhinum sp. PSN259]
MADPPTIDAKLYIGIDFNAGTTGLSAILLPSNQNRSSFDPIPIRIPLHNRNSTIYTCLTRLPNNPLTGQFGWSVPAKPYPWLLFTAGAPLTHLQLSLNHPSSIRADHDCYREINRIHVSNYSPGTSKQRSIETCAQFLRRFWTLGIQRTGGTSLPGWQNFTSIITTVTGNEAQANAIDPIEEVELPNARYRITKVQFYFAAPGPYADPGTAAFRNLETAIQRSGITRAYTADDKARITDEDTNRKVGYTIFHVCHAAAVGTLCLFGGIQRYKQDPTEPIKKGEGVVLLNIGEMNIEMAAYKFRSKSKEEEGKQLRFRLIANPHHLESGELQARKLFEALVESRLDKSPGNQNDPRVWMADADQLWLQLRNMPFDLLNDTHQRYRIHTRENTRADSFSIAGQTIVAYINEVTNYWLEEINNYFDSILADEKQIKPDKLKYLVVTGTFANFPLFIERLKEFRKDLPHLEVIVPVHAADAACLGAALYAYNNRLFRYIDE